MGLEICSFSGCPLCADVLPGAGEAGCARAARSPILAASACGANLAGSWA